MPRPALALVPPPEAIENLDLDVSIDNLELGITVSALNGSGVVTSVRGAAALARSGVLEQIKAAATDGFVDDVTNGPPMVTLVLDDSNREILSSGVFDYSISCTPQGPDGPEFHLVHVTINDDLTLECSFEHEIPALMRQDTRPLKVSRGAMTRGQFIWRKLVAPIPYEVRFVSPEIGVRQRVANPTRQQQRSTNHKPGRGAFKSPDGLTIKGASPTAEQWRNLVTALSVASDLKAGPKATIAMVAAGIGESGWRDVMNNNQAPVGRWEANPGGYGSTSGYGGPLQGAIRVPRTGNWFAGMDMQTRTSEQAKSFLKGGRGYQGGGGIYLAKHNPTWSPGQIADRIEGGGAGGGFYDRWASEARAIVSAYQGGGASFGGGGTYWKRYEFSRGQPGQTHESSWAAAIRLANEVRWRFFIVGKNTVYYADDLELIRGLPPYAILPSDEGFVSLSADVEVGGRYVLRHGFRQARPSEATMHVRADRWGIRPGSVVVLGQPEFGPAGGQWLVDSTRRSLFDADMEVNLRRAQRPLPEPRSEIATRKHRSGTGAVGGASTDQILNPAATGQIDKVYAAAKAIDSENLPYGPGGHGVAWRAAAQATSLDCSSSTSLALHAGGFMDGVPGPVVSSWFLTWGKPGRGKEMTVWVKPGYGGDGHVFIEFYGRSMKRFDTVPAGSGGRGPHLRSNPPDYINGRIGGAGGYTPRHWPMHAETTHPNYSGPGHPGPTGP